MAWVGTCRFSFLPDLGLSTWVVLEKLSSPNLGLGPLSFKPRRERERGGGTQVQFQLGRINGTANEGKGASPKLSLRVLLASACKIHMLVHGVIQPKWNGCLHFFFWFSKHELIHRVTQSKLKCQSRRKRKRILLLLVTEAAERSGGHKWSRILCSVVGWTRGGGTQMSWVWGPDVPGPVTTLAEPLGLRLPDRSSKWGLLQTLSTSRWCPWGRRWGSQAAKQQMEAVFPHSSLQL